MSKPSLLLDPDSNRRSRTAGSSARAPSTLSAGPIPRIAPDEPAAIAVHSALTLGYQALKTAESAAGAGEPAGVHKMRTSTRRLRSVLRTYADLLESEWAGALEEELKWLGHILGAARDLDVLQERLRCEAEEGRGTGSSGAAFSGPPDCTLSESARNTVEAALNGARFQELCVRLTDAVEHPRLRDTAWQACRTSLPPLVRNAWKHLKRIARDLTRDDPDENFHEVRKRAKHVRYAAEAVAYTLGPHASRAAARFAEKTRGVQDILGIHQDATIAYHELAALGSQLSNDDAYCQAAAKLLARQEEAARDARNRFFKVWPKFDNKKLRRWLRD